VLRWDYNDDTYYMAADVDPTTGTASFYGGKVDSSNAVNNTSSAVGIAYRPQTSYPVTGSISGSSLIFNTPLSTFGIAPGATLVSFSGFSLAGPADSALGAPAGQTTTSQIFASMRTVDASPPLDAVVGSPAADTPESPWTPVMLASGAAAIAAISVVTRRRRRRAD
jgi:hypothetical protein